LERKLAAILAADVVGYSRLMGDDETGTLERLKALRKELVQPNIINRGGRVVKLMGDGMLAEFPSAVEAVQCAVDIQTAMADRNEKLPENENIIIRIGINLGDLIVDGNDIYGDGVNVAARLEGLAEPGGICISGKVHAEIRSTLGAAFQDLGEQVVKNIRDPVRVYRWADGASTSVDGSALAEITPIEPTKPSIAVLPFDNMSGDVEQDYFADGMAEEIITALSRVRWLFVIARNSSFTYKGRAVDVKQVGRELGVRFVLEGSVRKSGNRVRITGQLIDANTGAHLWADHFDGALEDIFELQDQVTAKVVGAIAPRMEHAEIERARRKHTSNLDAYDYYLRGLASIYQWNRKSNEEALALFSRATELDPSFAAAYGMAARCYSMRKANGWIAIPEQEVANASSLARKAAHLGRNDPIALSAAGIALGFVVGELEEGDELIERALGLDPNLAPAWLFSGWVKIYMGEPEIAIKRIEQAMRLSPNEPHVFGMQSAMALAHFFAGRPKDAQSWALKAMRAHSHKVLATCIAAASAGLLDDQDRAQAAVNQLRQIDPELRTSVLKAYWPVRRPEDIANWEEGLRRAGLPE
jgi:TolB-like protein/Flp pilus assembly protein TadD